MSSDVEQQTRQGGDERAAERAQVRGGRLQWLTLAVAATFIVVGGLGFVPGVTSHYNGSSGMPFMGDGSHVMLFHLFRVSVFHNAVHLAYGLIGLVCAFAPATARIYLILGGIVYVGLFIYGLVIDQTSTANFVPVNTADNWLHLGLGVGMITLGFVFGRRIRPSGTGA